MIKFDDFDEAVIGPAMIWGADGSRTGVLVYDGLKLCEILRSRNGMALEDAREYIEFNMEGGYLGPNTPVIVWPQDEWAA